MQTPRRRGLQLGPADAPCFGLLWLPAGSPRGSLLFVPPLAEELNKTRRPVSQACAAFAAAGFAVLQLDLFGCGDSQGEFEDASWERWQSDVRDGMAFLRQEFGPENQIAWGLRAGCLLASELEQIPQLWWQPSLQGKAVVQQWLRLRLAAEMQGAERGSMAALRAELAAGRSVEAAGYAWSPALTQGLEAAQLQQPSQATLWLEATRQQPAALLPASQTLIDRWAAPALQASALADNAPWAALELEDCPALQQASLDWLQERAWA